ATSRLSVDRTWLVDLASCSGDRGRDTGQVRFQVYVEMIVLRLDGAHADDRGRDAKRTAYLLVGGDRRNLHQIEDNAIILRVDERHRALRHEGHEVSRFGEIERTRFDEAGERRVRFAHHLQRHLGDARSEADFFGRDAELFDVKDE